MPLLKSLGNLLCQKCPIQPWAKTNNRVDPNSCCWKRGVHQCKISHIWYSLGKFLERKIWGQCIYIFIRVKLLPILYIFWSRQQKRACMNSWSTISFIVHMRCLYLYLTHYPWETDILCIKPMEVWRFSGRWVCKFEHESYRKNWKTVFLKSQYCFNIDEYIR